MSIRPEGDSAYWLVGYTLFIVIVGTNLPTPLYPVYGRQWHVSAGVLTLIFATYALVLIPTLVICGRLSDYLGRRRVLLPGLLLAASGSVLFAAARGVVWLLAARAFQGLAVGLISGTATAALADLQPQGERSRAALVASITTVGGGAAGPLLAGLLAQYGPWPLMLPYLVSLVLLGLALLGVWAMPEPLATPRAGAWQIQRPGVPAAIRTPFALASAAAFVAWAVAALFLAVVPSYLSALLHLRSLALTGGIASLLLAASAAAQLVLRRVPLRPAMAAGSALLIVGLGGIVLAVPTGCTGLLLLSTVLAGCGQGLAYRGSTVLVTEVAPPEQRGSVLSTYYVMIYLGVGVPVLGAGFGAGWIGLYGAVVAFAGCTGCVGLGVLLAVVLVRKPVAMGRHRRSDAA